MISNISNIELKTIRKSLPNFKEIIEGNESFLEKGIYQKLFISVFDHWLTEDEGDLIFIDDNIDELMLRRDKFEKVVEELYKTTDIFLWKYKRNYRIYLNKPMTYNDILRKCNFKNLWSQSGRRYSLILPEFSAIYNEEWDWTNIIWYIDEDKIKPILEIANKVGLKILK